MAKAATHAITPALEETADRDFLGQLGRRVRMLRERRGLARRALAAASDVSERYLAQLEAGEGNISIVLLRRVAMSLGVTISEFFVSGKEQQLNTAIGRLLERVPAYRVESLIARIVREIDPQDSLRTQRIALIGLRGAGKSTLGAMLAEVLQVPHIELDREIELDAGMDLAEVFALYGPPGYRRIERRSLERVLSTDEAFVLSAGGGIVQEADTYDVLLRSCLTVWLRAEPEAHMARVTAQGDFRPMAGHAEAMKDLRRILSAREPLYEKADVVIDTSDHSPEESLSQLRRAITHANLLSR